MHLSLPWTQLWRCIRNWRDQMVFVKGKLRGPDTWVVKRSALSILDGIFRFLSLYSCESQVAKVHFAELSEILRPEGMDAFIRKE